MGITISDELKHHILQNRIKYISVLAALFVGLFAGTLFTLKGGLSSGYADNFISMYKLQGVSPSHIFAYSLLSYLRIIAVIWVSGRYVFLMPLNHIQIASKGFGIGCTISYMVSCFGISGAVFSFLSMFFQSIIFIPVLIVYSVYQINFSLEYKTVKNSPAAFKQKRRILISDLKKLLLILLAVLLCTCIEAYIVPPLIKPICTKFM